MSVEVWDWRRRTFALYAEVRAYADPAAAHAHWVEGRDAMLRSHPASAVPADQRDRYPGADVAAYDPSYRFIVPINGDVEPETREHETATDGIVPFERIGRVDLDGLGSLDVWWLGSYGGGLFIPVRDRAARSYGGGRYLIDTVKGADLGGDADALVVDLNFAYQPSCAYDEAWACPLAGPGNTLGVEVPVGEGYRDLTLDEEPG
jgi:uncharacterized protein (DUF1684 family)